MSDRPLPPPVLKVTTFDRATAGTIAGFFTMLALFVSVTAVWLSNLTPPKPRAVPVELLDLPGGFDDGSVDETLRVDSPEPEAQDASPADVVSEDLEIAETLETSVELTNIAAEVVPQQFETGIQNTGRKGSAKGTGRRAWGSGAGAGGVPREQRWFVRFGDRTSLDEYAKQLEFFRIELGALLSDGRMAYLSQPTQAKPAVRYSRSGKEESRLYMTWQGGERRVADVQLFAKAGVDVSPEAPLFHFYTPELENRLALLEREYRGRPAEQIRRTYFVVQPEGSGYTMVVVRQLFKQ